MMKVWEYGSMGVWEWKKDFQMLNYQRSFLYNNNSK
jgi:hypothetical protein